MDDLLQDLIGWLSNDAGSLGYAVVGVAAALEYIVPPVPGDTVAVFAVALSLRAGLSVGGVYAVLNFGAMGGGLCAYAFGRWLGGLSPSRWPTWLARPSVHRGLDTIRQRFERRGGAYLLLNRFVPALRAFFFVGAGIARLPVGSVVLYGGLSSALWNGLLLALGFWLDGNYERLREIVQSYSETVVAVLTILALAWLGWRWIRRHQTPEHQNPEHQTPDHQTGEHETLSASDQPTVLAGDRRRQEVSVELGDE